MTRRRFLKYGAIGGAVAPASALGAGYLTGFLKVGGQQRPAWEKPDGTVDYSLVPQEIENKTLKVAQWYDYWSGSALTEFQDLIKEKYNVSVETTQEIYTSDQELFTWITEAGKKFDVIFPADFNVEQMVRAGLLYNMNKDWLTNYDYLFDWLKDPAKNPYAYPNGRDLYAVPYQWGTTGWVWP